MRSGNKFWHSTVTGFNGGAKCYHFALARTAYMFEMPDEMEAQRAEMEELERRRAAGKAIIGAGLFSPGPTRP